MTKQQRIFSTVAIASIGSLMIGILFGNASIVHSSELNRISREPAVRSMIHESRPITFAPLTSTGSSGSNWSGHIAKAPKGTNYDIATGTFTVPTIIPGKNTAGGATVGPWVGLGMRFLLQAGVGAVAADPSLGVTTPTYYFWWEDFKAQAHPLASAVLAVKGGDSVTIRIHYIGNHKTIFTLENLTTGKSWSHTEFTPYVDTSSAEYIVEDASFPMPPPNFTAVGFSTCWYGEGTELTGPFTGQYLTGGPPSATTNKGNITALGLDTSTSGISKAKFTVTYSN